MSDNLTPETMHLNEIEPEGFCNTPRSLFHEVTRLSEAVLRLCDLQRDLALKVEAALSRNPTTGEGVHTNAQTTSN